MSKANWVAWLPTPQQFNKKEARWFLLDSLLNPNCWINLQEKERETETKRIPHINWWWAVPNAMEKWLLCRTASRTHTALGHSSVAKHGKRREWVMTSTPNEKLDFLWCNQSPYTASRLTLTNYNVTCTEPLVSSSRRVAPIHTIALNEWVLHKIISDQL